MLRSGCGTALRRAGALLWLLAIALGAASAIAAQPASGVLSKGTRFETPYYVQRSDRPGPTVVITGGVHGDEPAGAAAAEQIRHWPIVRGTLVVLPRANPPGLAAHTRLMPEVDKNQNNLNRNFPKPGKIEPAVGETANAIWAWVQSIRPTWLIDLHEGSGIHGAGSKSVGSSVIAGNSPEADVAAKLMLETINATITDQRKQFVRLGPPIDGSLARAAAEHLHAQAMILETSIHDLRPDSGEPPSAKGGQQAKTSAQTPAKTTAVALDQPLSKRVRQHRIMVACLLKHLDMIDPALDVNLLPGRTAEPQKTWVALYDAGGTGGKGPAAIERILGEAGMRVDRLGPEEIQAASLTRFDLLVVPGGSGSKEASSIGPQGLQQVREFVDRGGAYMGICAGAYLCTNGFDWSLKILNAKTVSPRWNRGVGEVKIELTPAGRKILGDRAGLLDVHYANGPIITSAAVQGLPDYEVLAFFRTELAKNNTPEGVMANSPAIAAARCGKGRVVFISPHPEQTPGLEDFVRRAAHWATGRAD